MLSTTSVIALTGMSGLILGSALARIVESVPSRLMGDEADTPTQSGSSSHRAIGRAVPIVGAVSELARSSGESRERPTRALALEILALATTAVAVCFYGFTADAAIVTALTLALIAITSIDLQHHLIPDFITQPMIWAGLLVSTASAHVEPTAAIYGAAAGYGALWVMANAFELVTGQQGLGYGDLKLTAMIGTWLGWTAIPGTILIGATMGFAVGTVQILMPGGLRDQERPFGPYLAGAGVLMMIAGPQINHAYLVAVGAI